MPKRSSKQVEEASRAGHAVLSASDGRQKPRQSAARADRLGPSAGNGQNNIPRWRQIEIMEERAALREALGDLDLGEDDYEEEVFGSEEENESLYIHDASAEPEVEDLPDDALDGLDYDDMDDD